MLNVRCQAQATLDTKGRLALPAPLKRACGQADVASLVVTFVSGALWAWTQADFGRIEREVEAQDPFADKVMDFAHALLAPAQDVEIDNQGRVRIPPTLRELAQLDKDVMVNSVLNRIEFWDRARWEDRFRQSLERVARSSGMPKGGA